MHIKYIFYYDIFFIKVGNHRQVGNDCTVYPYMSY